MKSAKFIVIEGLEGAGKNAIRVVEQSLGNLGNPAKSKKHASRAVTDLAEKLRSLS